MSNQLEKQIYAAFDPAHPLDQNDLSLYVDLDPVRGEGDIVKRMAKKIRYSEGKPVCQVLAGHRGSGKTTELLRLKAELETNNPKHFVVFCQADEDIDRNDVDFPDLLIAIVRQLARQIREVAGISLKPGYFSTRLEKLKRLLGKEVDMEKMELDAGLASLSVTLKGSPDARAEIRKLMEPDTGNLLHAANDVIGEAIQKLSENSYEGLVILVDDLDKMVVRPLDHTDCSSAEHLFVHRAAQLTAFKCHVVYSMPISLAYSHQENAIKASYGGHVPVVPMTKVASPPPAAEPHEPGIAKFREIIGKRIERAGAQFSDLFEDATAQDKIIALSGGQPFELMTLIREAIITDGLPIRDDSMARILREGEREYARQLRDEHYPILKAVHATGEFRRTEATESLFKELLESRAILQYVNGKDWYALNPMVARLPLIAQGTPMPASKGARSKKP